MPVVETRAEEGSLTIEPAGSIVDTTASGE
jgi:hypothetical protein